jgi:tetratricopeptide (TPR) repeat protein
MLKYLNPRVSFFLILLTIHFGGFGQSSFVQMMGDMFRPRPAFEHFQSAKFDWNIPGNVQVIMNEGLTYLDNDKPTLAINSFNQVISKEPKFWPAYYYRAICKRLEGKLPPAVLDFQQAAKLESNRAEIYFSLGETYEGLLDFKAADDQYHKAIDISSSFAEAYYGLGNIDFIQGNLRAAAKNYDRCIELNSKFTLAYLMQGFVKLRNGKRTDAVELINQGLEIDSLQSKFLLLRAMIHMGENKLHAGLKDLDQFVKLNPQNQFFLLLRGFLHLELGDFDRSYNDLRKAVLMGESDKNQYLTGHHQLDKRIDIQTAAEYALRFSYGLNDDALLHFKKGFCYFLTARYNVATDHFSKAAAIEPSATIYYLKAVTFEHAEKHDSAFAYYDKALKLDNEIFDAHKKRGIYRHQLKDWRGAYADFNEMIKQQPEIYGTYRLRGMIKYNMKDYYGALIDFSEYLKTDSTNGEVYKSRGTCRFEIKDYSGSNEDYRTSLRFNSDDHILYLGIADNHLNLHDTLSAVAALDTLSKWVPRDLGYLLKRVELYNATKRWEDALQLVNTAFKFSERDPFYLTNTQEFASLYHYRGEAYYHLKKYKDAIKSLTKSIEIKRFQISQYSGKGIRGAGREAKGKVRPTVTCGRKIQGRWCAAWSVVVSCRKPVIVS